MAGTQDLNRELMERLMERLDDVTDIKVQLSLLNAQMLTLAKTQEELAQAVKGAGRPGLTDRVKDLENFTATHPLTCPIRVQFMQMQEQLTDLQKDSDQEDAIKREQSKEHRGVRNSLFVSLVMLVVSTLVNITLYLTSLK